MHVHIGIKVRVNLHLHRIIKRVRRVGLMHHWRRSKVRWIAKSYLSFSWRSLWWLKRIAFLKLAAFKMLLLRYFVLIFILNIFTLNQSPNSKAAILNSFVRLFKGLIWARLCLTTTNFSWINVNAWPWGLFWCFSLFQQHSVLIMHSVIKPLSLMGL